MVSSGHVEFRDKDSRISSSSSDDLGSCWLGQDFVTVFADLRREEADPDLVPFRCRGAPEIHEVAQISWPLRHLPRDGAVNRDLMARDVLQNAFVCRGLPPYIVFRRQAVDRYDYEQLLYFRPLERNWPHRAGHYVSADSATSPSRGRISFSSRNRTSGSPPTIDMCNGRCGQQ